MKQSMQAIIFVGAQATGKSTFYQRRFFNTHVRISLDLLHTRHRESVFLSACLDTQQRFVVDNTNVSVSERSCYIPLAHQRHYEVIGYYFESSATAALERNASRTGKERIPDIGVLGTFKRLEKPTFAEGFDRLYSVTLADNDFCVEEWTREL
jgi:predicted kinase